MIGMKVILVLIIIFLLIVRTPTPLHEGVAERTDTTSNPEFKVSRIFTHDGVTVYRFSDGGQTVYYTDARGVTSWQETKHHGKNNTNTEYHIAPNER